MYRDRPHSLVEDMLGELLWSRHALGRPLIGTPENIQRISEDLVVTNKLGLHARPAARFAQLAAELGCEIEVGRPGGEEWVNGASVLSILSLAAGQGTSLVIRAEGESAEEAVRQLGAILEDAETP